ncbi:MAG: hypothetical protein SNJ61_05840, partial [Fimbriimonadaceae bacterium]
RRRRNPQIPAEEGHLIVGEEDSLPGLVRRTPVDRVVLTAGLKAQDVAQTVGRMFGISCSTEGFFLERHPKPAPVGTTDGVFLAGCGQGPKDIPDPGVQAGAAAEAPTLPDTGFVEMGRRLERNMPSELSGWSRSRRRIRTTLPRADSGGGRSGRHGRALRRPGQPGGASGRIGLLNLAKIRVSGPMAPLCRPKCVK